MTFSTAFARQRDASDDWIQAMVQSFPSRMRVFDRGPERARKSTPPTRPRIEPSRTIDTPAPLAQSRIFFVAQRRRRPTPDRRGFGTEPPLSGQHRHAS